MRKLPFLTAAALLFVTAVPVMAGYTPDNVTVSLRALSGPESAQMPSENTILIDAKDAAAGTSVHCGVFLETDLCETYNLEVMLQPDSENLTFDEANFLGPADKMSSVQSYSLPDGTRFSSQYRPFCFGELTDGVYRTNSISLQATFRPEQNIFDFLWLSGVHNRTAFLGGQSDYFSFVEVDVVIAPETPPGTYHINFLTQDPDHPTWDSPTVIGTDDSDETGIRYTHTTPSLEPLTIEIVENLPEVTEPTTELPTPTLPPEDFTQPTETTTEDFTEEPTEPRPEARVGGDVNADGALTTEDASLILNEIAHAIMGGGNFTDAERAAADYDQSGDITTEDVSLILQKIASSLLA